MNVPIYLSSHLRTILIIYYYYFALQCFNEFAIFHEYGTNETNDVVYLILANLFEGNCILPSPHAFEDELFEHIGVDGDVVTEEGKLSYFYAV